MTVWIWLDWLRQNRTKILLKIDFKVIKKRSSNWKLSCHSPNQHRWHFHRQMRAYQWSQDWPQHSCHSISQILKVHIALSKCCKEQFHDLFHAGHSRRPDPCHSWTEETWRSRKVQFKNQNWVALADFKKMQSKSSLNHSNEPLTNSIKTT